MSFTSTLRNNVRSAVVSAVACACVAIALLAGTKPAAATPCPRTLYLASTNGRYYVAVFAAPVAMKSSIDITVYSKTNAYSTSLTQISIDKPWALSATDKGFRSYTALLANPGDAPLLAAAVRPYGFSDDTICAEEERLIPSVDDVKTPPHPLSKAVVDLQSEIASEAGDGSNAFPMTPIAMPPNSSCAVPFSAAKLLDAVMPDPSVATQPTASQATVNVDVSETGAVTNATLATTSGDPVFDRAVIAAARKSKYAAPVFACIAQPGRYVFAGSATASTPAPVPAPSGVASPAAKPS